MTRRATDAGSAGAAVVAVTASSAATASMVTLLGALAVLIDGGGALAPAELGFAVAAFWLGSTAVMALSSVRIEHAGAERVLRAGMVAILLAIAGLVASGARPPLLVPIMVVSGLANGMTTPAATHVIAGHVPLRRQGLAFAIRQTSTPISTVVAGLSVPFVQKLGDWRYGYVVPSALATIALVLVPRTLGGPLTTRREGLQLRGLVPLAACFGIAGAAGIAAGVYFVSSAVDAGLRESTAGLVLAGGGASSVIWRVAMGHYSDRPHVESLSLGVRLLGVSTVGVGLLAVGSGGHPFLSVLGILVVMGPGSCWQSLLLHGAVRLALAPPAPTAGVLFTGGTLVSAVGPLALGLVAGAVGFTLAWAFLALIALGNIAVLHLSVAPRLAQAVSADRRSRLEVVAQPGRRGHVAPHTAD